METIHIAGTDMLPPFRLVPMEGCSEDNPLYLMECDYPSDEQLHRMAQEIKRVCSA